MGDMSGFTLRSETKIISESNVRGNWQGGHRRSRAARHDVRFAWIARGAPGCRLPAIVTITRIGVRQLDDDNLARACKAVRDEVASILGCDDSPSSPVEWRYAQRRGGVREYAVEIVVEPRGET